MNEWRCSLTVWKRYPNDISHISHIQPCTVYVSNEECGHTNDFGELLSAQRDSGKLGADTAKPSTQDPLGLLTAGRVFPVWTVDTRCAWRTNNQLYTSGYCVFCICVVQQTEAKDLFYFILYKKKKKVSKNPTPFFNLCDLLRSPGSYM